MFELRYSPYYVSNREGENMRDHKMLIRADARSMGAVTALSTTNRRTPRTHAPALTDCKVYASQDDYNAGIVSRTIARSARSTTTVERSAPVATVRDFSRSFEHGNYEARLAMLGATGDQLH